MKVVFMGTPAFSVPCLEALLASESYEVVAVYTQPPRPAGRGQVVRKSPVHVLAEEAGVVVHTPVTLKDVCLPDADVAVVVAYGLILPQGILDGPRLGCVNVHASLLPRWRGAAPIQRAILAGDLESGVTIMQMDAGLDTGAMLATRSVAISDHMTGQALHDVLSEVGARLLLDTLSDVAYWSPNVQSEDGVTYAEKLQKAEAELDWQEDAAYLERKVRAFTPWPGTFFMWEGERIKVLAAEVVAMNGAPGQVLDDRLAVGCGSGGALRPLRLQRSGKTSADLDAFLRGCALVKGTQL